MILNLPARLLTANAMNKTVNATWSEELDAATCERLGWVKKLRHTHQCLRHSRVSVNVERKHTAVRVQTPLLLKKHQFINIQQNDKEDLIGMIHLFSDCQ